MTTTRTPGITVLTDGRRFIDKGISEFGSACASARSHRNKLSNDYRSKSLGCNATLRERRNARPTFTDCAARYLAQSHGKGSIDVINQK
jgi:hypothetical protein